MNASSEELALREEFARQGAILYNRGLASGSAGNMSVLAPDGNIIVTPTGTCLGRLDPKNL
ncbi:MAG: class II aldolase/adducin family protein, partial [Succinivibrio sp.]